MIRVTRNSRLSQKGIVAQAIAALVVIPLFSMTPAEARERRLTKAEFGNAWPLSVDEGIVKCLPFGAGAVVFEADGKTYAVNGIAKGLAKERGFLAIDSIWLEDPQFRAMAEEVAASQQRPLEEVLKSMGPPSRISIGPVLDSGVALCR